MTTTLKETDIADLNNRHIHSIDKLYRMHTGVASEILEIHDDHFVLQVQVHDRLPAERRELIIFNITKAWLPNPELKHCRRVCLRVVKSQAPAGLLADPKLNGGVQREEFTAAFAAQIRAIGAASKRPKILVDEYEGRLPLNGRSDLQRIEKPSTS